MMLVAFAGCFVTALVCIAVDSAIANRMDRQGRREMIEHLRKRGETRG